jgi:hypothetical protein
MHPLFGGISEQRKAAKHRFDDARALFDRNRWRGAICTWRAIRSNACVNLWMPAWRYNPDLSIREDAEDFLDAVEKVSHWIENNT